MHPVGSVSSAAAKPDQPSDSHPPIDENPGVNLLRRQKRAIRQTHPRLRLTQAASTGLRAVAEAQQVELHRPTDCKIHGVQEAWFLALQH